MKKLIFLCTLIYSQAFCQCDTIFTNSDKILCSIKEVTPDAVKFTYVGEDVINSVYKSTIQKIVFKSGRVQAFAEATSYKTVNGVDDVENVTTTQVVDEVKGLFKLGDVSAKARGTTALASMEKVKERAYYKLKIQASMMGGNIVYVTQNNTTENQVGSKFQSAKNTSTNVAGVAYSNKLPNYNDFMKLIGDKKVFIGLEKIELSGSDADFSKNKCSDAMQISGVTNESGLIMINAVLKKDAVALRVVHFSQDAFTVVYKDGDTIYNYTFKI